ncbi:PAS domain-containing sensor histidine kinase [Zarconia navalis]|uniref:PAS domain-containing sensor histidine kinase n=1 Tax=Zarconia navalis TaxID=2992134 RepID=UPI0021F8FF6E|nr:PAS domain S-box protein [Zarconia navalis]
MPGVIFQCFQHLDNSVSFSFLSADCRAILGVSPEAIRADARLLLKMPHPDDIDEFDRSVAVSAAQLTLWDWEGRLIWPSGKVKWVKWRAVPERQSNGEILWDGLIMDITARVSAEDTLQQAWEEVEQEVEQRRAELKQTREQLQLTQFPLERSPDAIFFMNDRADFLRVNQSACQIFGYSPSDFLSMSLSDIDPNFPDSTWQQYWEILKLEGSFTLKSFYRQNNGKTLPVEVSLKYLKFNDTEYSYAFVRDIRDREATEQAIRESEAKFRSMVENANDIIYLLTPDSLFSYVSPNWSDILGHSPAEIQGQPHTLFVHPEDLYICQEAMAKIVTTEQKQQFKIEYRIKHRNGTWRWHTSNLSPVRNSSGRVLSVVGIARDITDRVLAKAALQESEQRFRNLVETTSDWIWEINSEGVYTYVSPQISSVLGYSPQEVLGTTIFNLKETENKQKTVGVIKEKFAKQEPLISIENVSLHKNGHSIVLETNGVPFFDRSKNFQGYRGIDRDITERKQAEAKLRQQAKDLKKALRKLKKAQMKLVQSEKMSSLGQTVAGIAHEINNPICFIHGNLSHARDYIFDILRLLKAYESEFDKIPDRIVKIGQEIDLEFIKEDLPNLLSSMEVGTERIREIVLSLRNFSRLDESAKKKVDLHSGIDSTLMILSSRLRETLDRPEIKVVREYGIIPEIECFAGQLNQVFMNIISNAIDAIDESKKFDKNQTVNGENNLIPVVRITTEVILKSRTQIPKKILIRIKDNGMGMTESVKSKIFDPFFTTKSVGKGTGMGMSISYQIITEKHRGKLRCQSILGQGTEFTIEIPITS